MAFLENKIKPLSKLREVKKSKFEDKNFIKKTKQNLSNTCLGLQCFYEGYFDDVKVVFDEKAFDEDLIHSNKLATILQEMKDGIVHAIPNEVTMYPLLELALDYLSNYQEKKPDDKTVGKALNNSIRFLIQGLCQSGKSESVNFTMLLLSNILKLTEGIDIIPLFFVLNSNNHAKGFEKELRIMLLILKYIIVEIIDENKDIIRLSLAYLGEGLANNHLTVDDVIIKRNRATVSSVNKIIKDIQKLSSKIANKNNILIQPVYDECDYGSAKKQIMDKVSNLFPGVLSANEIQCSATPSDARASANTLSYKILVTSDYTGLPMYQGEFPLASDIFPDIVSERKYVSMLSIESSFPELVPYFDRKFRNDHITELALSFTAVAKKIDDFVFFRPSTGKSVKACEKIATTLREKLGKKWAVVLYAGDLKKDVIYLSRGNESFNNCSLKEVLVNLKNRGYIAVVISSSGRSNRGDSYPSWFKYFIDLCCPKKYNNTWLQGTFGRACGYDKQSICYFQQSVIDGINAFIGSSGKKGLFDSRTNNNIDGQNRTKTALLSFEGENS